MESLVAAASSAAPSPGGNTWLFVFAALATGGLLQFVWNIYQRATRGKAEDALAIAQRAEEQAAHSGELWVKYKVELEDARKQVSEYLTHLMEVNRRLGEANAKIERLEADLRNAHAETTALSEALKEAKARRDLLRAEVEGLQRRIRALEGGTLSASD